jgi:hypothetical protein
MRRAAQPAGRERVRRRAHRISAKTFDSKNGWHGAKSAFALYPSLCLAPV